MVLPGAGTVWADGVKREGMLDLLDQEIVLETFFLWLLCSEIQRRRVWGNMGILGSQNVLL